MREAIRLMREAIRLMRGGDTTPTWRCLMREAIRLMREAIRLMREAINNSDLAVPDEGGHPRTIRGTISQMREAIRLMREAISLVREAIREPSGGHQRVSREQSAALS